MNQRTPSTPPFSLRPSNQVHKQATTKHRHREPPPAFTPPDAHTAARAGEQGGHFAGQQVFNGIFNVHDCGSLVIADKLRATK